MVESVTITFKTKFVHYKLINKVFTRGGKFTDRIKVFSIFIYLFIFRVHFL